MGTSKRMTKHASPRRSQEKAGPHVAKSESDANIIVFADSGEVRIPLAQVSDGDLHRFSTDIDGREVRFFLIQKPDGKLALRSRPT